MGKPSPSPEPASSARKTGIRGLIGRMTASQDVVHAAQEKRRAQRMGGTLIREISARQEVTVSGTLRSVTLQPSAGVPTLVAELYDGSGCVNVVWLGRRAVGGIEPGRALRITGRVSQTDFGMTIFNPRYELMTSYA